MLNKVCRLWFPDGKGGGRPHYSFHIILTITRIFFIFYNLYYSIAKPCFHSKIFQAGSWETYSKENFRYLKMTAIFFLRDLSCNFMAKNFLVAAPGHAVQICVICGLI
jgi:hypothetical protein